jgi:hypothetical protein
LMVDQANGILIKPGNIKQLYEALKHMSSAEPGRLMDMKKRSIDKVRKEFVFDLVIEKFLDKIEGIKKR